MTNWIDSGGHEPRLYGMRLDNVRCKSKRWRIGSATRWRGVRSACFALLLVTFAAPLVRAHDHNRPDLNDWFMKLQSGKGPCCDGTDAVSLEDPDWEAKGSHYRVRVPRYGYVPNGQQQELIWVDVPAEAVISEPNRAGRTLVWPVYGYMGVSIRCFMPGSMT
ncbi:hypothetical protein C2U70_11855 [Bradyrhizobium guangdongense]|uniref:hypothetical protein n=1 Tax=Bradyrhizobium guangdongense TaxID=1325090 RepID=UPI0011283D37|nr:hypothetical protein [Bradyrhizobium guangdongense]TPQ36902.1 hypothetical protein C2U70_11855 [Bradyrhizobium guangdongense]